MVVLINPNLVAQTNDLLTTGIVYMPVGLAHFAGAVRGAGLSCTVIDALGESPKQCRREDRFLVRGLDTNEIVRRVPADTGAIVLYAINLTYHRALVQILQAVRRSHPGVPVIILENTQAVTAYSLRRVQEDFFEQGATFVITGEGEDRGIRLLRAIAAGADLDAIGHIDGIGFRRADGTTHYTPPAEKIANLDALPLPAWDLFPLQQYWDLKY